MEAEINARLVICDQVANSFIAQVRAMQRDIIEDGSISGLDLQIALIRVDNLEQQIRTLLLLQEEAGES